jgi:hypothetical protein
MNKIAFVLALLAVAGCAHAAHARAGRTSSEDCAADSKDADCADDDAQAKSKTAPAK